MEDDIKLFQRRSDTVTAEIDGELVALNVEKGTCYGLNAIATRVWSLLAEPTSVEALCGILTQEYEVEETTCRTDVEQLLGELVAEELVQGLSSTGKTEL
jgi:hypothetical protein